jgi:hypothetical protein
MMPQTTEPMTVPLSAKKGTSEALAFGTPYSLTMPGMVNPRLAGFMMSMISAMTSTLISTQCARDSGKSSGGDTTMSWLTASWRETFFGNRP